MNFIVADWKRVLLLSLSLWAQIISLALFVGAEAVYAITGVETDPYVLGLMAVGYGVMGILGRFIKQPNSFFVNWLLILGLGAAIVLGSTMMAPAQTAAQKYTQQEEATMTILLPMLDRFEGMRLQAYLDPVGIPTICLGSTFGVRLGMSKTLAECYALARVEAKRHRDGLRRYYLDETILARLPPKRDAAFTDLAYNVGVARTGSSTAMRRLNGNDIHGACAALTWYDRAGNKRLRGLVIRRSYERQLCLAA